MLYWIPDRGPEIYRRIRVKPRIKRYAARMELIGIIAPLAREDIVAWMKSQRHHVIWNVYDHSLAVSYMAFLIARRWRGCDPREAARAGFLHDLYLYDRGDRSAHPGAQCLDHPEYALRNAEALCPDLSWRERNAIESHMFPLARHVPRCRIALAVNLADKICAVLEGTGLSRTRFARARRPAPQDLDPAFGIVG